MKKHLTLLGVAAMATAVFAGCSNDEIVESYQGEEISFRTRIETRATELDKTNLGNFSVIAKGMHPTGNLYTAYLIGEMDETTKVVTGETAKKDPSSQNIWKLGRDVYWPSGMEQVLFWAYTTQQDEFKNTEEPLSSGTVKFEENGPIIEGFEPTHASLEENNETGIYADGSNQKDLLIAFAEQNKSKGTSVTLNFKHALSQIDITAHQKDRTDNDNRIVKVKGAWIVNVNTKGNLQSGFAWDSDNMIAEENPKWDNMSNPGIYGAFFENAITLNKTDKKNLLGAGGNLMIVPQSVEKWTLSEDNTICGATTGAGWYPPTISDDMLNKLVPSSYQAKINRKIPENKSVGALILDEPIKFEVSVDKWVSTENPVKDEEIPLK